MSDFQDKTVLLIAPKFFGYEFEVKESLEKKGAKVIYIPDRPYNSSFSKAITRFFRPIMIPLMNGFYKKHIKVLIGVELSYIFVIQGEGLSIKTLNFIKSNFPDVPLVLYMWDSIRNKFYLERNLRFFDFKFSFDPVDSREFEMIFRPLFYTPRFVDCRTAQCAYDISFVGTIHSDRYAVLSRIMSCLKPESSTYFYLYLQARWVFYFRKLFGSTIKGAKIDDFKYTSLNRDELSKVFFRSRIIVDVEHPKQVGLTMRTFEAMGARKKLVTTNFRVKDYDFYSESNIMVLHRGQDFSIPDSFFFTEYELLNPEIEYKYSIDGWVREIFTFVDRGN